MTAQQTLSDSEIGILAYGSLISDPGIEITPLIIRRFETVTPFPVEYARLSKTRGGAPTVVPFSSGIAVKAQVLVLDPSVTLAEARSLLWRREVRKERSGKTYPDGASANANAVIVRDIPRFGGLAHALFTDFHAEGKVAKPIAPFLAEAAIRSVHDAGCGKDGITYLMRLKEAGVETALTPAYVAEILSRTGAPDLAAALRSIEQKGGHA